MVPDMSIIMKLSLAIFVAVYILPSAFGIKCQSCSEKPLQSPKQCNMSSFEKDCAGGSTCIALTAELTNGTCVGMLGCFPATSGYCTDTSACNQRNGTLSGPAYFARCVAVCCTEEKCNTNLPMLPEPSSTVVSDTTQPYPTSLGIKMKAFLYLHVFLLVTLYIMN